MPNKNVGWGEERTPTITGLNSDVGVPASPQPTPPTPNSWINIALGDVIDYGKTTKAEPTEITEDTWVLELEDIEKDSSKILQRLTFAERKSKSTKNRFHTDDVLYGKLRPYLNKIVIADSDGVCSTEIIPLASSKYAYNRYLFYWLKHPEFLAYVTKVGYGVNMPRLGTKDGKAAPFVLAPLAEQKQIAAKLDELLAQVDTLKTRLDAIPAILKRFRQSVLAAAVSGRLTEEWREDDRYVPITDNCSVPCDWEISDLDNLSILVTSGSRGWAKYYSETGSTFIRAQNINSDELSLDDAAYVDLPDSAEGTRTRVILNDILITITGANVTKCARVNRTLNDAYVSQHVALVRLSEPLTSTFIDIVLKAINAGRKQLIDMAYGGGKPGLNLKNIKDVVIALPSKEEQTEIVRRVEQLFTFADQVEQRLKAAQSCVNHLTQSILAKAFRGELTAEWRKQNPDLISGEHSAQALLARITAERKKHQPVKRTRKRKAG